MIRKYMACFRRSKIRWIFKLIFLLCLMSLIIHLQFAVKHEQKISNSFNQNGGNYSEHIEAKLARSDLRRHNMDIHQFVVQEISCDQIFKNDTKMISKALELQDSIERDAVQSLHELQMEVKNCSKYREKYVNIPVNREEAEFPIAYSLIVYKDLDIAARLLRAIYRPQNYYCIHIDAKSPAELYQTAQNLTQCFDNVFIASGRINVKWGWYSVVEPDVLCMQDLFKYKKWKYFINLTGQEFPLRTNLELVHIFKAYNGANSIAARLFSNIKGAVHNRMFYQYINRKKTRLPPFKHNLTWAKGAVHVAVSRAFVDFLLNNQTGIDFMEHIRYTSHGSEHLFNPLQMSPQLGVPGAYTGTERIISAHTRYKAWRNTKRQLPCRGKYVRDICILNIPDLPQVVQSPNMFINKLHADYHPLAYDCLEQRIFYNALRDVTGENRLNMSYYLNSEIVKHHL